jgi:hypothetical protein
MEKVVCVSQAKVPIVKIWDPELGLACDMNVNNTVALENTRMVRTYVQIDERVRPLAMIVKYWTRRRILNDAGKYLSLLITDFQQRDVDISPSLWRNAQFIHVDLHDHRLSAAARSSCAPILASEGKGEVD